MKSTNYKCPNFGIFFILLLSCFHRERFRYNSPYFRMSLDRSVDTVIDDRLEGQDSIVSTYLLGVGYIQSSIQ
jgi:hypothetical protein